MTKHYYDSRLECNMSYASIFLVPQLKNKIEAGNASIITSLEKYGLINSYTADEINDSQQQYQHHMFLLFDKNKIKSVDEEKKSPLILANNQVISFYDYFLERDICVDHYEVENDYVMLVFDLYKVGVKQRDLDAYYASMFSEISGDFIKAYDQTQESKNKKYILDKSSLVLFNVCKKSEILLNYISMEYNVGMDYITECFEKVCIEPFTGEIKQMQLDKFQQSLERVYIDLDKIEKELKAQNKK